MMGLVEQQLAKPLLDAEFFDSMRSPEAATRLQTDFLQRWTVASQNGPVYSPHHGTVVTAAQARVPLANHAPWDLTEAMAWSRCGYCCGCGRYIRLPIFVGISPSILLPLPTGTAYPDPSALRVALGLDENFMSWALRGQWFGRHEECTVVLSRSHCSHRPVSGLDHYVLQQLGNCWLCERKLGLGQVSAPFPTLSEGRAKVSRWRKDWML